MSFLLALMLAAKPVKVDEFNFSITPLDGWERVVHEGRKDLVHFRKDNAHVQVIVARTGTRTLDMLVEWWRKGIEADFQDPEARVLNRKRKFGGVPCLEVDIEKGDDRLTWLVARHGKFAYAFVARRPAHAGADGDIAKFRASFRFLKKIKPTKATTPTPKTPPKPQPRKELKFDHWLFGCVKPKGMSQRAPKDFDASEKAASVVARFDAKTEQSLLMIRVFAHARAKALSITMLGEQRIKEFIARYPKHKEPIVDRKWKLRLAKKSLHLRFVGLRSARVTEDWYFAKCRNGFTYQIQVYRSGAGKWDAPIKDFLEHFKPRRKGVSRMAGP